MLTNEHMMLGNKTKKINRKICFFKVSDSLLFPGEMRIFLFDCRRIKKENVARENFYKSF